MGIIVQWKNPTPDDNCPVCAYFGGVFFDSDFSLPLPAHPHCDCFYSPVIDDTAPDEWEWEDIPDDIRRFWITTTAWYLRSGQTIPPALQELIPEAEIYNKEREENTPMKESKISLSNQPLRLAATDKPNQYRGKLITAGRIRNALDEPGRFIIPAEVLKAAVEDGQFEGLACFVDHADWFSSPSMRNLFGAWHSTEWDEELRAVVGTLRHYPNAETDPIADRLDQMLIDEKEGLPIPDTGISIVFYAEWELSDDVPRRLKSFRKIESGDIVFTPAADGRILEALSALKGEFVMKLTQKQVGDRLAASKLGKTAITRLSGRKYQNMAELNDAIAKEEEGTSPPAPKAQEALAASQQNEEGTKTWLTRMKSETTEAMIAASNLPLATRNRLAAGNYATPSELDAAIVAARTELAALVEDDTIALSMPASARMQMKAPADEVSSHIDWFFGVQGAKTPPPNYRNIAQLYTGLTGDYEFYGKTNPERMQFSGASTISLADLAANAMNKVIVQQFNSPSLIHWRWYELVTFPTANDGSVQDMQWTTLGGVTNLPTVSEKGAYTELDMGDVAESDSFIKKGGYVGITLEMIKNSQIAQIQAVPRALATAAVRTRSATIAALFTANSGVGPTLEQDSKALFHADHNNLATTAFSSAAWEAAQAEAFAHTEVQSGKAIAIFPRYCLIQVTDFKEAQTVFGYGDGKPTTYNPHAIAHDASDPRPIPLVVPDWTDTTDWGYIVDPLAYPVIHMSYAQAPGGGVHPMPELFSVVSATAGLQFTNDTLPIKVRDWFAAGVNGARGIGKRNVA